MSFIDSLSGEIVFAIAVALTAGLVRGFSGFGAGMIMAPCFSVAFGPVIAIPLIQIMDSAIQVHVVPPIFKQINWRQLVPMIVAAIIFMPLGVYLLVYIDADVMRISISVLVLVFVALLSSGWRYERVPNTNSFVFTGAVSGVLSGSASMGGPPVVFFNLLKQGSASEARNNIIGFFAVTSVAALVVYWINDLISQTILFYALLLTPVYSIGTLIGGKMFYLASEKTFRMIALIIVAMSGVIGIFG